LTNLPHSSSIEDTCQCSKEEYIDENNRCQTRQQQPLYTYSSGGGGSKLSSRKNDKETLIYGGSGGATDEGRFNQILTAKQMSINVVDLETLKVGEGLEIVTCFLVKCGSHDLMEVRSS
jgi:hypothetical protein